MSKRKGPVSDSIYKRLLLSQVKVAALPKGLLSKLSKEEKEFLNSEFQTLKEYCKPWSTHYKYPRFVLKAWWTIMKYRNKDNKEKKVSFQDHWWLLTSLAEVTKRPTYIAKILKENKVTPPLEEVTDHINNWPKELSKNISNALKQDSEDYEYYGTLTRYLNILADIRWDRFVEMTHVETKDGIRAIPNIPTESQYAVFDYDFFLWYLGETDTPLVTKRGIENV